MKIAIAGTGYVGLSIAVLLAQHNEVVAYDIVPDKVEMINALRSPIADYEIEKYLSSRKLTISATTEAVLAFTGAVFAVESKYLKCHFEGGRNKPQKYSLRAKGRWS